MRGGLRLALVGLMLAGCSQAPAPPDETGPDLPDSLRRLERTRAANPRNPEVLADLASEYYRLARKSLDEGDEAQYRFYLARDQAVLIEAIRIDPKDPEPHNLMGILRAYQGDLDSARASFANALRLQRRRRELGQSGPQAVLYTNLAHIDVYRGALEDARNSLETGRRRGAEPSEVERIRTLLAWRSGDRDGARRIFEAARTTPGYADTWDSAPLPEPMKTFEDFCAVCCRNPSCGPHLADSCRAEGHAVKERAVTRETLVEEMRLERERRAKLKEIYESDREVTIDVEPDPTPAPAPPR